MPEVGRERGGDGRVGEGGETFNGFSCERGVSEWSGKGIEVWCRYVGDWCDGVFGMWQGVAGIGVGGTLID